MTRESMLRAIGLGLPIVFGLVSVGRIMYGCGSRSRDGEVTELNASLVQSERTLRLKEGLYATKLVETKDLSSLLDRQRVETKALVEQLDRSKSQLLTTQQVAVRWKSAYEGALTVRQIDSGPSPVDPGVVRKRVDFQRDFGPISVSGHTLTDPAEGEVSVRQSRPLLLTVNVARDLKGRWSSLVTSSEPTMEVDVSLGGVDLGVIPRPSWRQRIWLDVGTAVVGDFAATAGVSYRGERFSLGVDCFVAAAARGCGLTGGVRIGR